MQETYAVGHLALGYLLGKLGSRPLKISISIPLVFALAVIPDVDLLFEPALVHRGPLHSIVVLTLVFVPFFIVYRKAAIPYFLAIAQHPLIGDYLGGGHLQLFWPLSNSYYGLSVSTLTIIVLEWVLFLSSIVLLAKTRDAHQLFLPNKSNLLLVIPLASVAVPTLFEYPLRVPLSLIPAHIAFGLLFFSSITWTILSLYKKRPRATDSIQTGMC